MPNAFNQMGRSVIGPALGSVAITPLDATSLDTPIHAITLNAAGTLLGVFDLDNGQRISGRFLAADGNKPGQRVVATDTTAASGIATFKVESQV